MKEKIEPKVESPQETQELKAQIPVFEMSPRELVDHFTELEKSGQLSGFLEEAMQNDAMVAKFSYWEKWLKKDHRDLVDRVVSEKKEMYPGDSESLPLKLEKKFTPEQLRLIIRNIGAIQLTFGCSKGCPFCGFDAVKGVRESMPYSQLANLFQRYGKELDLERPLLYWASEPSDYASSDGVEDKTYEDVHQLAVEYANYSPEITSREVDNDEWLNFLEKQQQRDDAFMRGSVRTSVYGLKEEEYLKAARKSIQLAGEGEKHRKGVGISSEKNQDIYNAGIGCFDGVLLTPRGLYNVAQVPVSKEYPQGQIVMPIEKIGAQEIKVGDSLTGILRGGAIIRHKMIENEGGLERKLITLKSGDKTYDVAIDENYKITDLLEWTKLEEEYDEEGVIVAPMPEEIRQQNEKREQLIKANIIARGYTIPK